MFCTMQLQYLFLLVYMLGTFCGGSSSERNSQCTKPDMCNEEPDSAFYFLQCAGLPSSDSGRDHLQRLKGILEATMDVYSFMRSSLNGVPLVSLEGQLQLNGRPDPFQNEALVQMWLEIKMKPLLKSITKHFLSCLSTKNFSCSTYQTVLREFSYHYSELTPAQQKWIYTFFMHPFLSGDEVQGCADPEESSEEWLLKNFGAFRAMARIKDFSALNMVFSGVEVLHLLSPAQKAELLMRPEVESFENGTLSLIFHSLTGGSEPTPTAPPGGFHNWTTPADSATFPFYPTQPAHQSHHRSPIENLREVFSGFLTAFKPVGSFVHDFVSFTSKRNLSEVRSVTVTQFLLNWTLAELADRYRPKDKVTEELEFDVTNVEDWYQQVAMPLLQRFFPNNDILEHPNIKLAFHQLFYLDHAVDDAYSENTDYSEIPDVCSITLDKTPCGLTDAVENVAHVLHCAARTNLTLNEETIMRLILELTKRLNSLIKEMSNTNFKEVSSEIKEIFGEGEAPTLTQEHLNDPNFIQLWFKIKLLPLLPDVHPDLLSCLSTKNFSCPVYQSLVSALGESMSFMDADPIYSQNIYKYFIYSFLQQHNFSECASSANNSADWLEKNVGFFSKFASITDFYELNPFFSGLDALHLLTPNQTAEMLLLPLRTPPEKDVVINYVLNYLIESPEDRKLLEVLHFVIQLAQKVNPPCSVYTLLVDRLYAAIPSLPSDLEPLVWAWISDLINVAPKNCTTVNFMCPQTHVNGTSICKDIDSSDLEFYISMSTHVPCNFTLEKYACAQLENFAANQLASLLRCDLPRNSSRSRVLWKLLLTKLSNVLDPALDLLTNMSMVSPSAPEILDVIGEMRLFLLTNEQLMDSNVIKLWFSERLSGFLPSASEMFLLCLSSRNLSCQSYHQIVQVFSRQFRDMTFQQQQTVLRDFILRFLSEPHTGPGCVSTSNSSAQWLTDNLGSFSELLSVSKMFDLNPQFNPIEALSVLSPKQSAELLVLKYPTLPNTDVIINKLFDYFTESPRERKFTEFLSFLVVFLEMGNVSCPSYKTLFTRLDNTSTTSFLDIASSIMDTKLALTNYIPAGCIIYTGQCNVTMVNEADICFGVNSTELQLQLDSGKMNGRFCEFPVEEFACASLSALRAEDLAAVMKCGPSSSLNESKPVWKLLLVKSTRVLDEALDLLANTTFDPSSPSVSVILDGIREIRLDLFSTDALNNPSMLQLWFNRRLHPFLPAVSTDFLSCLATKELQCSSYQFILQSLSLAQTQMNPSTQMSVSTDFIQVYLSRNDTADGGCLSSSNSSAQWLKDNLGSFSELLSVTEMFDLNPQFNPIEALSVLSPKQSAELLVLKYPTLPNTDVIINKLFDYFTESPRERKFTEFLSFVVVFLEMGNVSCTSYKTLFTRFDNSSATSSLDIASSIMDTKVALFNNIPPGCIIYPGQCKVTTANEADICFGVNSTELQLQLDSGKMNGRFCDFPVEEFACASLSALRAQDLAAVMKCGRSSSLNESKPVWKLLLVKSTRVLDEALDLLANTTFDPSSPSVSVILDSIREIRLDLFSTDALNNPSMLQLWFNRRLHPFLPAVSTDFLSCLATKELQCSSYQFILQSLSLTQTQMNPSTQMSVYTDFIQVYLSRNDTAGCLSASISSAQWLRINLGSFSEFASVSELFNLYPQFNPIEALSVLSPKQSAELLVLKYPTLPNTDVIINKLFDYFTESPRERKFTEFLSFLVVFLEMGTLSCTSYKTLFTQLDYIEATASLDVASFIPSVRANLSKNILPGCAIFSGECNVVTANESNVCVGVNSTELQLQLNSGKMGGRFCDFSVEEFACASLSALTAQDLAEILKCNRSSSSSGSTQVWKLLLNKASGVLDAALDLLTNSTINPMNPSASMILDSIQEIKLDQFSNDTLNDPLTLQLWFNNRLRPFLSAVSNDFLSCLSTKDLQCSSYQYIVQILSQVQPQMALPRQISVYTNFIKIYLKRNNTADPGCIFNINSSSEWLQNNVGGFSVLLSIQDFQELYPQFSAMEALSFLSIRQLAEVFITTGQITTIDQVTMVMSYVPDQQLGSFFDNFSPAILGREYILPSTVRSAMLQVVFYRANLSSQSVSDAIVSLWLQVRLRPLLVNLAPYHVAPYFQILSGRNCSIEQQGVNLLNQTISSLSNDTQTEIQSRIIQALQGPSPLRCYGDNYSYSFYSFLRSSFLGFQFPNLTTFLSLIPPDRNQQLINSMPPSDLGDFLRHTNVVGQESQLCQLYSSYLQIPVFLETESLPEQVRQRTLPCVWPIALRSSSRSEVNAWFDRGLPNYLVFLTKTQINQITSINASCLAFQKIVSALGSYNYSVTDFTNQDVYNTIKVYLSSATSPKCYDSNNPELNSTAWFAEYIGSFITFLTVVDLQSFGSQQDLQLFTVNPQNLLLLNQYKVDVTIVIYYIHLVYQQDINFSPLGLPSLGQCFAPGRVFTQLTSQESLTVLGNVNRVCTDLDPQIAAALASNFGENIDAKVISALGNESTSLSISQIKSLKPSDLVDSLNILSNVIGWRIGQAKAIVLSLLTSGSVQINSSASLLNLGSLISGVPSTVFSSISGSDLVTVSRNPSVLFYILSAPQIVQLTFVIQIIYLNTNSLHIIENVPDNLATEIPGVYLLQFPNDSSTVIKLNRKKWKPQQVALFFDIIAANSETAELGGPNNLSSSVLQGFTCTTIRSLGKRQIKNLIKACRRKGTNKVPLVETQLTCMYNQIKDESDATSFSLYPPDVLLYYDYSLVPQSSCRSYFQELADADFSIFSPALTYKRSALFDNARSCLGITSTSLSEDNVSVLGNMCCILDGSYIQNSHPSILEQLKNCPDLTVGQSAAVETLLTNGNTPYGLSSTWNEQTLKDLGMLTLHLPSSFYQHFDQDTKRNFLKYFLKVFGGVSREQRRQLKKEIRQSIKSDSEQTAECTVGIITQVTISDPTFPFDYNINQFNNCLSVSTVKDNLDAITEKVDEVEYLRIVLQKLQEADNSIIPEDQIQLLSAASRVATVQDILSWTISKIDTLAALMDSSNGGWDPSLAKVIISKYLAVGGNKLGSAELNVIGGPNLCSLDVDVIRTISSQSFREVDSLDISSCTADKKKEFFTISFEAFNLTTSSVSVFQLIQPYIGGANVNYIRSLVVSDVNMDLATFTSLDENVVLSLNARQVKAVLGTNLPDLKSYENQTLVQTWIRSQNQSELDILGLGIRGGKVDPPIPPYYSSTTTLVPTTTNTTEFKPSPASTTEPPTSISASTLSPTTTNVTEFNPSPASTTEPPTSSSASTLSPTTTNVTEFNPSPASTTEPPTSSSASTLSPTRTNVTEFNPSPASTTEPPTSIPTSTLSPTTTNVTEFNPSPASTTEPPTSSSASTLSPTTTNVTEFHPSPASTTEPPTSSSASTLSPTTTNVTEFNPSPASTTEPPTSIPTSTSSPTTTNVTEFNPSPASTTEPPTSSSASTLSPTTTNVTEFHPSPASTTEPPTSIPTSTLSPTTTNVTEFNPSPASTTESPTSIPTSTSSPTTTNVTEFNPSPPSTAKPTTAGSTTTTSTTNIISGTTRLPTVLSSTTTSQPPSRTSTSTTTVLPTDIYTVQCQVIAANESNTCIGVNSTGLQVYLDSGKMNGRFCNFSVEEFACASLSALTAQDLVEIMTCDLSSNSSGSISAWNLLFCKTSRILNAALNLLTTATINPNNPAVSVILDSIQAISPDLFSTNTLNNLTELQLLFNVRLRPFLPAVSTNFLSILAMKDLQCSSYQYIVQIFSKVQPQMTLSKQESVYTQFIKIYLSRKNTAAPKCYDSNNPELKSTAWFAEYISSFITFLTVVDLKSFGSEQVLQVFTVNPLNIALLSQPNVDLTLISYYTQLVYQQVSNFNPLLLPSVSQCYAPGPVFTQLNATVSMTVYEALNEVCTSLDEQISATLISNFGNTIGSNVIAAIGNGSASLSTSQIKTITALELMKSLSTLSIVTGWREGQAKIIMQTLLTLMKINSSSSLSQLGTLVIGLPSNTFSSIISSELIAAAKNPLFVANMLNAAQILQQSFVYQIVISNLISLNIIDNVPDQLATQIPRVYLQQFTGDDIIKLNKKTWKREQVELFFDVIAAGSATTVLGSPNSLSSSVLQGFTCTGVSQFERKQVTDLVKACRRKGLNKVPLLETQLTCMYNYIRTDPDVTKFDLYPPDVLLYYDYSLVPQSSCRSYFQELADADFSVFSSVLSYKLTALFDNARSCLGITNTSLTEDNVSVLGNMCCMLDGSYIKSSDPSILKKLKNCPDLTADQAAAVVTLLTNGNTQYGTPSKWNQTTLTDLGMLPLYLPTSFYDNFDKSTKVTFLKSFLKVIKDDKVSRDKRRQLKEVIRQSIKNRSKRSTDCTVGNITQVTISDSTFPLDYDVTQFNNCLSNTVVKDNFDAITEKVDEKDYLKIVLQKLGEAYNFVVPEDQVQVLGPASRVATIDDIRSWTITQVDTLSALMDSSNGDWNSSLAKVIISKYLAVAGNSLGRAELNAIKGPNLCSLDLSVIQSISSQNLKEAEALNVISCTLEAKKKLFNISSQSFRAVTQSSSSYQLMKQFLGGAPLDYIRGLVSSNISMDLETFSNLDPNIVPSLTVNEVKGLLGTNLPDLKSYENQPLVQAWIRSQLQSELDTLGLNLSGGRADPVTTATLTTTAGTVTAGSGGSVTTGSGVRIQADAGFSFFSFLAILITSQLITI